MNTGCLIYVVGPSGAGKDSVLDYARAHLAADAPVVFARRTITRPSAARGEHHNAVTDNEFAASQRTGAFAIEWEANGLRYGIGTEIRAWLAAGKTVVVNGSREHLLVVAADFPTVQVVHITASTATIRTRLAARGRETPAEVEARLTRGARMKLPSGMAVTEIANDGALAQAGDALLALLAER